MSETEIVRPDQKFISIGLARKEDVPEIMKIAAEGGLSEWSAESYLAELDRTDSIIYTASEANRGIVGFLCGRITTAPYKDESQEVWIYNVGVLAERRKRGVGSALLKKFLDKCELLGIGSVWLEVRKNNAGAISFYRGHGFREIYSRANFYVDPVDDALILSARIDLKA